MSDSIIWAGQSHCTCDSYNLEKIEMYKKAMGCDVTIYVRL